MGNAAQPSIISESNGTYRMDLANKIAVHPVGTKLIGPERQKFVQIEISDVVNPATVPIGFDVHYRPGNGEKVLLGMIALFPPDKPGTFIVATRGLLRRGGAIVVSMLVLKEPEPTDRIQVTLKRISFRTE